MNALTAAENAVILANTPLIVNAVVAVLVAVIWNDCLGVDIAAHFFGERYCVSFFVCVSYFV